MPRHNAELTVPCDLPFVTMRPEGLFLVDLLERVWRSALICFAFLNKCQLRWGGGRRESGRRENVEREREREIWLG